MARMGAQYKASDTCRQQQQISHCLSEGKLQHQDSKKHLNGWREYHNGDDVLTIISNRSQARTSTLRIAHTILVVFKVAEDQLPVYLSS